MNLAIAVLLVKLQLCIVPPVRCCLVHELYACLRCHLPQLHPDCVNNNSPLLCACHMPKSTELLQKISTSQKTTRKEGGNAGDRTTKSLRTGVWIVSSLGKGGELAGSRLMTVTSEAALPGNMVGQLPQHIRNRPQIYAAVALPGPPGPWALIPTASPRPHGIAMSLQALAHNAHSDS